MNRLCLLFLSLVVTTAPTHIYCVDNATSAIVGTAVVLGTGYYVYTRHINPSDELLLDRVQKEYDMVSERHAKSIAVKSDTPKLVIAVEHTGEQYTRSFWRYMYVQCWSQDHLSTRTMEATPLLRGLKVVEFDKGNLSRKLKKVNPQIFKDFSSADGLLTNLAEISTTIRGSEELRKFRQQDAHHKDSMNQMDKARSNNTQNALGIAAAILGR